MTEFNCAFCAAPIRAEGPEISCPRCRQKQPVPESPPFFHDFAESQLAAIRARIDLAKNLAKDAVLDRAVRAALEDDRRDALEEMHTFDSHLLHALEEDLPNILLHGYMAGRVSLGTAAAPRALSEAVADPHETELPWRLRETAGTILHDGALAKIDPLTQYCLWHAFNEWLNFEFHRRNIRDETATLVSRLQEWVKMGFLLALAEERLWAEAHAPPPAPPRSLFQSLHAVSHDVVVDCETIEFEPDGAEHWSGYRFFDALGREIPKDPYLEYGALMTQPSGLRVRRNRLNLTQFLHEHRALVAAVHHITDGRKGTRVIYSDFEAGALPLRDFFVRLGAEI